MKRTLFHILATLTVLALLCGALLGCTGGAGQTFVLPTRALAGEETYTFGSYSYQLYDDGTAIIVDYTGSESNLTLPDSIDGKTVVAIGDAAFISNTAIQTLKLNKSLETIASYAFCACTSLTSVSFGRNVWSIGEFAFDETPWLVAQTDDFVVVGDGVLLKYLGKSADVVIPDGIKHLSAAFAANETLVGVEMGPDVLTVGNYAFAYTPTLRRVVFGENVRSIGAYAFDGCTYLPQVILPDGVERIGSYAFNDCNYLVDVKLGASLREIDTYAFKYCSRMLSVTLPASVERIAGNAFADCYSIMLVYYGGTEEQFDALALDGSNVCLADAHVIYESGGELK